jgi:hypothetical protein
MADPFARAAAATLITLTVALHNGMSLSLTLTGLARIGLLFVGVYLVVLGVGHLLHQVIIKVAAAVLACWTWPPDNPGL